MWREYLVCSTTDRYNAYVQKILSTVRNGMSLKCIKLWCSVSCNCSDPLRQGWAISGPRVTCGVPGAFL